LNSDIQEAKSAETFFNWHLQQSREITLKGPTIAEQQNSTNNKKHFGGPVSKSKIGRVITELAL